jgi:hypothetical protein
MNPKKLVATFTLAVTGALVVGTATAPFWGQDKARATQELKAADLTPTQVGSGYTDYGWLHCNTSTYATKFEAVSNKTGEKVEGYFCSGPFFSGSSIETTKNLKP